MASFSALTCCKSRWIRSMLFAVLRDASCSERASRSRATLSALPRSETALTSSSKNCRRDTSEAYADLCASSAPSSDAPW